MSRISIALLTLVASLPGAAVALAQTLAPVEALTSAATDPPPGAGAQPDPPSQPGTAPQPLPPTEPGVAPPGAQSGAVVQSGDPANQPEPNPVRKPMYRWVDKDGVLNYSDTPPQPGVTPNATRAPGGGARDRK